MYYNGRNDIFEMEDVIGVESISLSTNASDGRRFVTLDLEISPDLDLAPVEKLMVCLPDGATPRLFIPKQVLPITPAAPAAPGQQAPSGDGSVPLDALNALADQAAASGEPVAAAPVEETDQTTQEVPVVTATATAALPLIGG